jgi:DNA-binding response OmpR family regulator
MRVLLVEDHVVLARTVGVGLRREGMAVDIALDGTEAIDRLSVTRYDVVILDRDLPNVHGDEVCRWMVEQRLEARVLMLTASSSVSDRVHGLELGADDYLPKPFDFTELVARVRALGRRAPSSSAVTFSCGDLVVDPARRMAKRGGQALSLSPKEFAVLECLLASDGRVVSSEELLERVWDDMVDPFTTTVKTTVLRLRNKLGPPQIIETVREGGYRIPVESPRGTE